MAVDVNLIMDTTNGSLPLMIRKGPGVSYGIIGSFPPRTKNVKASKEENGWYYMTNYGGWSSGQWLKIVQKLDISKVETPEKDDVQKSEEDAKKEEEKEEQQQKNKAKTKEEILQDQIKSYLEYDDGVATLQEADELITKDLEGIYGIPYQFMSSVDMKAEGTQFGCIYADKIVSRMPLLLLSPGKVDFLRDWKNKDSAATAIMKLVESSTPTDLNDMLNGQSRYYTFDFDFVNYYKYVNAMCISGAYFLGLENTKIKVGGEWVQLKNVDFGNAGKDCFKSILSNREYVAFYVDSASTVNESFGNSTSESQLANAVNTFSDVGREISFLTGSVTGAELMDYFGTKEAVDSAVGTVEEIANKYLKGNQLFKDIANNFATVAVGGKLIFPEIWSDSDYSKSYDINIKLRTPDGDKLSWFMNIYVPLAHLICLTAPKQASDSGPNGYVSPFLVRAYYKGLFNCDMGIVTSLDITRGKEKAWTLDGLPTEVDVSMTIKDLYNMFTLTSLDNPGSFVNNISLVNYIANSCGININERDFVIMLDVYIMLQGNRLKHVIPNVFYYLQQSTANRIMETQEKLTSILSYGFLN